VSKYNLKTAREKAQLERMIDLRKRNICAFCPENIRQETTSKVEIETDYWIVKKNDFPYKNTKYHYLVIPKEHIKTVSELSDESKKEFLEVISFLEKKFKFKSYDIGIRSGDIRLNGGSVEHLHAQIIVGDVDNPNHKPIRFKMSSSLN
jgi:diadenosine tetraphosphate (Ap4A) HIT family hydrolase